MRNPWPRMTNWYWRYERRISSVSLLAGFVFDALFLKRVDLFMENFWIIVHLLMAAGGIFWLNLIEHKRTPESVPGRLHFWLLVFLQFAFGGLFSTFLVFYFRSATLAASWPFLAILTATLLANERLREQYARLTFQISILFISLFSFFIFFLPIIFHQISAGIFLLSGLASLLAISLFLILLKRLTRERFRQSRRPLVWSLVGTFLVINFLYFANLIPPIPLALKDAGVYHAIGREASGDYVALTEPWRWQNFFHFYEPVRTVPGAAIYAYSAVFSPTALNTSIVHEWQFYDPESRNWETKTRVALPILGGRDNGYRTYSERANLAAGQWRVNVETARGQLIGRLKFEIIPTTTSPALVNEILS